MDQDVSGGGDQTVNGRANQYGPTVHKPWGIGGRAPALAQSLAEDVDVAAELGGDEAHICSSLAWMTAAVPPCWMNLAACAIAVLHVYARAA